MPRGFHVFLVAAAQAIKLLSSAANPGKFPWGEVPYFPRQILPFRG
jgi:hypothetical protein